jgi:hypothetical protein
MPQNLKLCVLAASGSNHERLLPRFQLAIRLALTAQLLVLFYCCCAAATTATATAQVAALQQLLIMLLLLLHIHTAALLSHRG